MKRLLVTVDSLRYDHLDCLPNTRSYINQWHDKSFATSTATLSSFPAIIGGKYADEAGLQQGTSLATKIDEQTVGVTTNHLLSPTYGYDEGFGTFSSPKGDGESFKERVALALNAGSVPFRIGAWVWNQYQRIQAVTDSVSRPYRTADMVINDLLSTTSEEWFGWIHLMEPHHPYNPENGPISQEKAQRVSRKAIAGQTNRIDESLVKDLYKQEIREMDARLSRLWEAIPDETRVVFCADHGELLGEDDMWGHPGEMRQELLQVPFGTRNAPELGDVASLIDIPSILLGAEHRLGELDRDIAFAAYGEKKAAMNTENIATNEGIRTLSGGDLTEDPQLERALSRFESGSVVKEDALKEDLEDLGYI